MILLEKTIMQNIDINAKNRENCLLGKGEVTEQSEPRLDHLKVCVPPWLPVQINY